jgi:hypothetical protein
MAGHRDEINRDSKSKPYNSRSASISNHNIYISKSVKIFEREEGSSAFNSGSMLASPESAPANVIHRTCEASPNEQARDHQAAAIVFFA